MAKLKFEKTLRERLAILRKVRDESLRQHNESDQKNESYKLAVLLRFTLRTRMERWLDEHKDADALDIANAILAVSNDVLETGLRLSSNDAEMRGAVAGRFLNQFVSNATQSGLIEPPGKRAAVDRAMKTNQPRSLLGPDGKPYRVQ